MAEWLNGIKPYRHTTILQFEFVRFLLQRRGVGFHVVFGNGFVPQDD